MIKIRGEYKTQRCLPVVFAGLVVFFQPLPAWSFTLQEAVEMAVKTYPEVLAAEEDGKSLKQKMQEEYAGYLPQIDITAGYGREYSDNPTTRGANVEGQHSLSLTRGETGLTLDQMVFDGYEVRSKVAEAEAKLKGALANLHSVSDATALSAIKAYVDVVIYHDQLQLAADNVTLHQDILSKVRKKFEGGAGNEADVHQAESRTYRTQADHAELVASYEAAQAKFLEIVGQAVPEGMSQPLAPEDQLPATMETALEAAHKHNPDLEKGRFNVVAKQASLKSSKAAYYPKMNLELDSADNANMSGSPGHSKSVAAMVRVNYNVYNGGADAAGIGGAKNLVEKANQNLAQTQRSVDEQVQELWSKLSTTRDRVSYLEKHVAVSRKVTASYHDQFKMGKRTLLDVLNSENELFSAQDALLFEQLTYIKTSYEMLANMGSLRQAFAPEPSYSSVSATTITPADQFDVQVTDHSGTADQFETAHSSNDVVVPIVPLIEQAQEEPAEVYYAEPAAAVVEEVQPSAISATIEPEDSLASVKQTTFTQAYVENGVDILTPSVDAASTTGTASITESQPVMDDAVDRADAATEQQQTVIVDVPRLNLRQEPDLKSPRVALLQKGTVLTVEQIKNGWLHVQDPEGNRGWVAGHLTQDPTTGKRLNLADKKWHFGSAEQATDHTRQGDVDAVSSAEEYAPGQAG